MSGNSYYGNHLGLVINSSDPEYRGRVQVFVPHIMPALYEGWNEQGADIDITCVGSNIPQGMTSDLHSRLVKILPWAESASPIIGGSSPGNLFTDVYTGVKNAVGSAASAVSNFFNQGPTSQPTEGSATSDAVSTDGINTKPGVSLNGVKPNLLNIAKDFSSKFPSGVITSGTDGRHSDGSAHYTGEALDIRTNGVSDAQLKEYVNYFASQPDVDFVYLEKTHLHIQTKPGRGGFVGMRVQDGAQRPSWFGESEGLFNYARGGSGKQKPSESTLEQTADSRSSSGNNLARADGSDEQSPTPETAIVAGGPTAGTPAGTISGGGTVSGANLANMSPAFKEQYERVLKSMEGSKFDPATTGKPVIPNDGKIYGIKTGSKEEWAHFFTRNASVESSFNPNTAADIKGLRQGPLTSFGLYQMGSTQFNRHGGGNIYNPDDNTRSYINYAEEMYFGNTYRSGGQNVIGGKSGNQWLGLAAGYGPIRRVNDGNPNTNEKQLLGENIAAAERQSGNYTGTVAAAPPISLATSVVNNTDDNGRTPVMNTNDMPNGMFAYPNPGAMVWVFFREGNPLYPVYFAASYSATEWKNAYRGGSEGDLMSHGENDPTTKITSSVMKLHPAATILAKEKVSLSNPQDNEAVFSLCHQHGSNITFKNGCDFHFSRNNKRDEVDNDRFVLTKGYKEQWTQGDESSNTRGNQIIKIGNISQEAIDAMNELANMSYEMNQVLMNK